MRTTAENAAEAEGDQGGGDECESMTADECSAAGGMVADTPSCLLDPCAPSANQTTVCCSPGAGGARSADVSGHMHRLGPLRVALASCLLAAGACLGPRPAWVLMHPPEVRDESYPRGYRLLPTAPIAEWRGVATFDTEAACEAARTKNLDDSIDRARAEHGYDAKYELTVRRAVHAECVTAEPK